MTLNIVAFLDLAETTDNIFNNTLLILIMAFPR